MYDNYYNGDLSKYLNQANNYKEILARQSNTKKSSLILPDLGLILSYGEGNDFVPAGAFSISRFVDKQGNTLTTLPDDYSELMVEFVECEFVGLGETQPKENGSKIYIPYDECNRLFSQNNSQNNSEMGQLMGEEPTTFDVVALFERLTAEIMADMGENRTIDAIQFGGELLETSGSILVDGRGENRGSNYTIIPFSFGQVKKMIKELSMERKDLDNDDFIALARCFYYAENGQILESISEERERGRSR